MRRFLVQGMLLCFTAWTVVGCTTSSDPGSPSAQRLHEMTEDGRNQEAADAAYDLLASAEARHGERSLEAAEALELLARALARAHPGDSEGEPERLGFALRALDIRRELGSESDPALAWSYYVVGLVHSLAWEPASALKPLEKALKLAEAHHGEDSPAIAIYVRDYGATLFELARYEDALGVFERHRAIRVAAHGEGHPATLSALYQLAPVHAVLGNPEEADRALVEAESILMRQEPVSAMERARVRGLRLSILALQGSLAESEHQSDETRQATEMLPGPDAPEFVGLDNSIGRILIDRGDYDEAAALARTHLGEEIVDSDEPWTLFWLDILVEALWRRGKFSDSETEHLARISVKLRRTSSGPAEIARSLRNLGEVLRGTEAYAESEEVLEEALGIMAGLVAEDDPRLEPYLTSLGNLFLVTHQYEEAGPVYERALAIALEHLGPDHPDLAPNYYHVAAVQMGLGDFDRSRNLFRQAANVVEADPDADPLMLAKYLNGLAVCHYWVGEFIEARAQYERVLAIRQGIPEADPLDIASVQNNLGLLLRKIGDYEDARKLFEEALALRLDRLESNHSLVAQSRHNLATALTYLGRHEAARAHFEEALAVQIEIFGEDNPVVGTSLKNFADLLTQTGRGEEARPLYGRALEILERLSKDDAAWCLNELGAIEAEAGNLTAARELLERTLDMRTESLGPRHPSVAETWLALGSLLSGIHPAESLDACLLAEEIATEHVVLTSRTLPERQALRYAAERSSGLDLALTLSMSGDDSEWVRRSFDALIHSRAIVLDEMGSRRRDIGEADDPEIARLLDQLRAIRRDLASATLQSPDHRGSGYRERLDALREDKDRVERALAERSIPFRRQRERQGVGLAQVREKLPSDTALVSFVLVRVADLGENAALRAPGVRRPSHPEYLAVVLAGPQAEPRLVRLGPASVIDPLVSRWQRQILAGRRATKATTAGLEADYRRDAEPLRRAVWEPIAPLVNGARRVMLVPDGALHLVNFSALPDARRGYLIETAPPIHYLSAERDIVSLADPEPTGRGFLVLGGADFDHLEELDERTQARGVRAAESRGTPGASCAGVREIRFQPLPASSREAEVVGELLERIDVGDAPEVYLTGTAASEATVKRLGPGKRILHLATHGFFLDQSCPTTLNGSRGIGGLTASNAAAAKRTAHVENPLLLSGLALAGANVLRESGRGGEDGILTAEEVASMDLQGIEWAVLSACDTGRGHVAAGEGVFGFQRAFRIAGARTVIMSLWPVADYATYEWMRRLYEGRVSGKLDTAGTVREASLGLLRSRQESGASTHPYFWAAFVASGDWR